MRRLASFGSVTAAERRQADLFFDELMGVRPPQRSVGRWRAVEAQEEVPALQLGPLSDAEWRTVIHCLTVGEAEVGAPLTADASANALKVAARIFCSRNALSLQGDPLVCLVSDVTTRDPRVVAMVPHVVARGPIILWQLVPIDDRIRHVMALLVGTHGYPVHGAAGLVGNLLSESGVLPQRIEGSAAATPMRAPGFGGRTQDFTADDIVNRSQAARRGPRLPGIGLAQWTTSARRSGLFQHSFRGVVLGPRILFDLDAQVDYLVTELRSPGYAAVDRVLRGAGVSVDAASDEVLYSFEIPGAILENGRKLPRTDPRVEAVFRQRRGQGARALRAHTPPAACSGAEYGEAAALDEERVGEALTEPRHGCACGGA
jgi:Phage tail lysozyme